MNWPVDEDDLPPELVGVAGSLRRLVGRPVDRDELLQALLEALEPRVDELGSPAGRTGLVVGAPVAVLHHRRGGPGRAGTGEPGRGRRST